MTHVPETGTSFLVPVSGKYVMGIIHGSVELMFSFLNFFVQEVNKPNPHLVTVWEVKAYGFSDFTISEGFSSQYI